MNIINAEKSLKYLNYGSVGFIIARELSHIFDEFVSLLSQMKGWWCIEEKK
jgi:predicted metalloendopeptidase